MRNISALHGVLFASCLVVFLLSCRTDRPDRSKLTIATAANMQFVMKDLIEAFTEETGIICETVVSSSGKLTAQIEEGAPFDLFISADMKYPARLFEEGLATDPPDIYAYGKLVLWSMIDGVQPGIDLLQEDHIGHIALANPRTAPYGVAATEVLDHFGLSENLNAKLVYGESIAQTNQFIISKAAEMGFTAKSVVLSPQMKGKGQWIDVDPAIYTPIAQGVVMLRASGDKAADQEAFYDFLFSEKGREILTTFGYEPGKRTSAAED